MTLPAFQQALCELIGSPELCLAVRGDAREFLARHDLSPRERDRLIDIVWQRGMSTNCTLYRSNRVTPIYTLLHYTCAVLGSSLKDTLDAYWAATDLRDLEFKNEIHRFARFMRARIETGIIGDPLLEEVLDFEMAVNELRYAPRRDTLARMGPTPVEPDVPASMHLHPLMRVVRFRHEPGAVLDALANGQVPRDLPETESFLLLSVVDDTLKVRPLDVDTGRVLRRLHDEGTFCAGAGFDHLVASGIVVRIPLPKTDHAH